MKATLFVVQASHPCWAVKRAMELKDIGFKRVEWPPTLHVPMQRLRFGQGTVPGLIIDGEKVIGSRTIMHRLDELRPDPLLYPAEPEARRQVEETDRWGEEVLQALARRIIWWTLRRSPRSVTGFADDSQLPLPDFAAIAMAPLITRIEWRINDVSDASTRRDLHELPGHLDRVDGWVAEGVLGEKPPNAADLQIGASLALLNTCADLQPLLDGRPRLDAVMREFGEFPGHVPSGTVPPDWLAPAGDAA
ncbi:MAG: glutathione S-transferase N-terminal domain-containing protein [Solirubrobacterales bacterium]